MDELLADNFLKNKHCRPQMQLTGQVPHLGVWGVCVGVGGWNVHLSLRTLLESITYGKTAQAHD